MAYADIPKVRSKHSHENMEEYAHYLANTLALMSEQLDFVVNGKISSKNVQEIAGYNVTQTQLKHKSGIVGMSGADASNPNAVRFWAGAADMVNSPWRVHQNGVMYATGAVIQSAAGYPKIAMNLNNNIIAAYSSPSTYIAFTPQGSNNVPALNLVADNSLVGFLSRFGNTTTLGTFDGENLNFQPSGSLRIGGVNGSSGSFFASSAPGGPADTQVVFTKGIRTG